MNTQAFLVLVQKVAFIYHVLRYSRIGTPPPVPNQMAQGWETTLRLALHIFADIDTLPFAATMAAPSILELIF